VSRFMSLWTLPFRLAIFLISYIVNMGFHWKNMASRNGKKTPPTTEKQTSVSPPEPAQQTGLEEIRNRVDASLTQMVTLLKAIKAPLPTGTGDGTSLPPEKKTGILNTTRSIIADLSHLGINSIEKVATMGIKLRAGEDIDDREYLMEYLIDVSISSLHNLISKAADTLEGCRKAPR
jgi:hypothetical protein